jgi:two-component system OmpR family response regulator
MAGKTILIVEDSPHITVRILALLKDLDNVGFIDLSGDCSSAMSYLRKSLPDIVLLDINLPGGSGLDLLRYIKGHHPRTAVIMLTNQADAYYRRKCKELGAVHFIDKSREFQKVSLILSSLL